jgi:asparagine synthase (glutamine-hydrolysing)
LWGALKQLVYVQDEPFGSTSIYSQYRVMQLARETGVTVLLDGQGGDEVFGGYRTSYAGFFLDLLRARHLREIVSEWRGLANAPFHERQIIHSIGQCAGPHLLPAWAQTTMARRHVSRKNAWLREDYKAAFRRRDVPLIRGGALSLREISRDMITRSSLPTLLRYEDRNSMAWSVEARTPFADDRPLIEYALQLPNDCKIRKGWSKWALREAMRPVLPHSVYTRKDKVGFATPERAWLRELGSDVKDVLGAEKQFLNRDRCLAEFDRVVSTGSDRAIRQVWRFVIFAMWREVFAI